jgi:diguanylate cyclase (GGDEF)-like protein
VTVSIGVSSTDDAGFDSATLIASADAELYHAKTAGRNRVGYAMRTNLGTR